VTGLLGLLSAAAGPVAAMFILLRRTRARDLGLVVCLCAAWGLGTGTSSLVWSVLRRLHFVSATTLTYLDAALWAAVVLALAAWFPRTPRVESSPSAVVSRRLTPGVIGAMAILLPIATLAAVTFAARSVVAPQGEWDAWAVWNARARALFWSLPAPGVDASVIPVLAHPDYPELLPASIARAWTFAGVDAVSVPVALAAMFAGAAALLAGASIRRRSTTALGLLTAAFILASPALVNWTWSQGADVPLSFYFLLTCVLAASAVTTRAGSLWAFAGLSAGLSAWTKNEGVVFLCVVAVVAAIWTWRAGKFSLAAFAAGATPALLVLLAFKLTVTHGNELIAAQSLNRAVAVFTWDRISMIGQAMGRELWYGGASTIGALPVLVLFVAVNGAPGHRVPGARLTLVILTLMLAAYALVYVLTPRDLAWHLRSSLDRLILQLMPSIVWVGMLVAAGAGRADESSRAS
jgi:hypothetical protein